MASNVGSTATITGNPQNMMIGSLSHIGYADFAATLAPVAVVGLALTIVLIALFHRKEFATAVRFVPASLPTRIHRALMLRALAGVAVLALVLFSGQPPAKAAIIIAGLLLLTRRVKSERVMPR